MANFRFGKEAAAEAATSTGGGGKFTPTHQFGDGETTYLQFLTSWEKIATVLMHRFICVGYREDGNKIYRDFISPLDNGGTNPDPLVDRFGSFPKEKCIGLAVELEPQFTQKGSRRVINGWDVVMREYETDDGTKSVPNIALVIESPYTLYGQLGMVDDQAPIEEKILSITRKGKKKDTQYSIIPVDDALSEDELNEAGVGEFFDEFDFNAYLEELADEDRLHEIIDPLPDDFPVNPYAKMGKGKSSKQRSQRERREVVLDDEPSGSEEAPSRSRRFEALKRDVEGK